MPSSPKKVRMKPPPAAMGHGEDEGELKGFEWSTVAAMMRAMMKLLNREKVSACQLRRSPCPFYTHSTISPTTIGHQERAASLV